MCYGDCLLTNQIRVNRYQRVFSLLKTPDTLLKDTMLNSLLLNRLFSVFFEYYLGRIVCELGRKDFLVLKQVL